MDGNGVTMEIKGRDLLNGVPEGNHHHPAPHRRSPGRTGGRHRRSGEGGAGSHAAGTGGRHRRQGHRADRRRLAAGQSGPGAARRNRPSRLHRRRSACPASRWAPAGCWKTPRACATSCPPRSKSPAGQGPASYGQRLEDRPQKQCPASADHCHRAGGGAGAAGQGAVRAVRQGARPCHRHDGADAEDGARARSRRSTAGPAPSPRSSPSISRTWR